MVKPHDLVCENCFHCNHVQAGVLDCRRYPPAVLGGPLPPQIAGPVDVTKLPWLVRSFYPPVRPENACGEFRAKPQIVN